MRLIALVIAILLFAVPVFAYDYQAKIGELRQEAQALINQKQDIDDNLQQIVGKINLLLEQEAENAEGQKTEDLPKDREETNP